MNIKTRPMTRGDLKGYKFNKDAECMSCMLENKVTKGCYRLPDYYVCYNCAIKYARVEDDMFTE